MPVPEFRNQKLATSEQDIGRSGARAPGREAGRFQDARVDWSDLLSDPDEREEIAGVPDNAELLPPPTTEDLIELRSRRARRELRNLIRSTEDRRSRPEPDERSAWRGSYLPPGEFD